MIVLVGRRQNSTHSRWRKEVPVERLPLGILYPTGLRLVGGQRPFIHLPAPYRLPVSERSVTILQPNGRVTVPRQRPYIHLPQPARETAAPSPERLAIILQPIGISMVRRTRPTIYLPRPRQTPVTERPPASLWHIQARARQTSQPFIYLPWPIRETPAAPTERLTKGIWQPYGLVAVPKTKPFLHLPHPYRQPVTERLPANIWQPTSQVRRISQAHLYLPARRGVAAAIVTIYARNQAIAVPRADNAIAVPRADNALAVTRQDAGEEA